MCIKISIVGEGMGLTSRHKSLFNNMLQHPTPSPSPSRGGELVTTTITGDAKNRVSTAVVSWGSINSGTSFPYVGKPCQQRFFLLGQ